MRWLVRLSRETTFEVEAEDAREALGAVTDADRDANPRVEKLGDSLSVQSIEPVTEENPCP